MAQARPPQRQSGSVGMDRCKPQGRDERRMTRARTQRASASAPACHMHSTDGRRETPRAVVYRPVAVSRFQRSHDPDRPGQVLLQAGEPVATVVWAHDFGDRAQTGWFLLMLDDDGEPDGEPPWRLAVSDDGRPAGRGRPVSSRADWLAQAETLELVTAGAAIAAGERCARAHARRSATEQRSPADNGRDPPRPVRVRTCPRTTPGGLRPTSAPCGATTSASCSGTSPTTVRARARRSPRRRA